VRHEGPTGQGGGDRSAPERWVNSVGGTRVRAAALVDNEPQKVADSDGK
jgi:hypothetical protein